MMRYITYGRPLKRDKNSVTFFRIWKLSDVSVDGMLDKQEFCLAMYLVDLVVNKGQELPASLPDFLHPSKHRDLLP
jgi:hypothetical protein